MFRLNLKEIGLLAGPAAAADSIITLDGTTVTSTVRLVGLVEALTLDNAVLLRNIDSDHAKTERLKDTDIGKEKTDKIITLRLTGNSMRSGEKKTLVCRQKRKLVTWSRIFSISMEYSSAGGSGGGADGPAGFSSPSSSCPGSS